MPELRRVSMQTYRYHRIELLDDGSDGWVVRIHAEGGGTAAVVLRNAVPNGLPVLLSEAKARVDRHLDGSAWQREP
jgi:hypothetical protein